MLYLKIYNFCRAGLKWFPLEEILLQFYHQLQSGILFCIDHNYQTTVCLEGTKLSYSINVYNVNWVSTTNSNIFTKILIKTTKCIILNWKTRAHFTCQPHLSLQPHSPATLHGTDLPSASRPFPHHLKIHFYSKTLTMYYIYIFFLINFNFRIFFYLRQWHLLNG